MYQKRTIGKINGVLCQCITDFEDENCVIELKTKTKRGIPSDLKKWKHQIIMQELLTGKPVRVAIYSFEEAELGKEPLRIFTHEYNEEDRKYIADKIAELNDCFLTNEFENNGKRLFYAK
jgi:hypothetical protein